MTELWFLYYSLAIYFRLIWLFIAFSCFGKVNSINHVTLFFQYKLVFISGFILVISYNLQQLFRVKFIKSWIYYDLIEIEFYSNQEIDGKIMLKAGFVSQGPSQRWCSVCTCNRTFLVKCLYTLNLFKVCTHKFPKLLLDVILHPQFQIPNPAPVIYVVPKNAWILVIYMSTKNT